MLHEHCTSKSGETSIKFPLTVRVDAVFLLRTQQLKADNQNKEPKQEVEASKTPEQIHDFHNMIRDTKRFYSRVNMIAINNATLALRHCKLRLRQFISQKLNSIIKMKKKAALLPIEQS